MIDRATACVLASAAVVFALIWSFMRESDGSAQEGAASLTVDKQTIYDAIKSQIVDPLRLPQRAADVLMFQSSRETGRWAAWYFQGQQPDGLPPTFNLFNRRVGTGRGEWTGQVKMIHGDDTRIYSDVYQSARDFRQRLTAYQDMAPALAQLKKGEGAGYFNALETMEFSARVGDYTAYAQQWASGATA